MSSARKSINREEGVMSPMGALSQDDASLGFDILGLLELEMSCPNCGQLYQVPVIQVFQSQEMLTAGCTCRSEQECPPIHLAPLLSHEDLQLIRDTCRKLCQQARDHGAHLGPSQGHLTRSEHHLSLKHQSCAHGAYFSPFEPTHPSNETAHG